MRHFCFQKHKAIKLHSFEKKAATLFTPKYQFLLNISNRKISYLSIESYLIYVLGKKYSLIIGQKFGIPAMVYILIQERGKDLCTK